MTADAVSPLAGKRAGTRPAPTRYARDFPSIPEPPRSIGQSIATFLDCPLVTRLGFALILINVVTLSLEAFPRVMAWAGGLILGVDRLCLAAFLVGLVLRLYVQGMRFFRSGWNVICLVIIGMSLLPATGNNSVLRALRILRVMRVVSAMPSLRRVVNGLGRALPEMG